MKILIVASDYRPALGGIATYAFELARAMAQLAEVRVLAPSRPGSGEYDSGQKFTTIRVPLPSGSISAIAPLSAAITYQAATWRPDVILCFLWLPDGAATYLALPVLTTLRIPYFIVAHGVELLESQSTVRKRVRGWLAPANQAVLKHARAIFPNSHFTQQLLAEKCGVKFSSSKIIFPGVNLEKFSPGPKALDLLSIHGLARKKVFLTVTRLVDYKGVDRVISAMRKVHARFPDAIYVVVGEGDDRARLESLVRHYDLEECVRFVGRVEETRIAEYYRLADCVVLCSREDWLTPNVEGFGLVFLEAAATGKPAIAGESGGISDAVVNGTTGWLVDPEDEGAIATAMLDALKHPHELEKRGKQARDRVLAEFTWKQVAEKFHKELQIHVRN